MNDPFSFAGSATRGLRWWAAAMLASAVLAAASTPGPCDHKIEFPNIPGYFTMKGDFHQHTVFSDGKVWPSVRVDEAVRTGVDAMAITDHLEWQPHHDELPNPDRNRAYEIAKQAASLPAGLSQGDYWLLEQRAKGNEKAVSGQHLLNVKEKGHYETPPKGQDVLVVNGVEVTRPPAGPFGHVNALFIQDANRLLADDPAEVLREAARQGAFALLCHPYWGQPRGDDVARLTELQEKLIREKLIQGIEVVNGDTYSEEALRIALDHNLTMFGNSDVHTLVDWEFPRRDGGHRPVTLVFVREKTEAGLKEALFARRTAVWFRNLLIGRREWLDPLLSASITAVSTGYQPDPKKFSIQARQPLSVLDVELRNASDANFILRSLGPYTMNDNAGIVIVPPHGSVTISVKTLRRLPRIELPFEVMNAVTAPGAHPAVRLAVDTGAPAGAADIN